MINPYRLSPRGPYTNWPDSYEMVRQQPYVLVETLGAGVEPPANGNGFAVTGLQFYVKKAELDAATAGAISLWLIAAGVVALLWWSKKSGGASVAQPQIGG